MMAGRRVYYMKDTSINLLINGKYHELKIADQKTLLEVLREDLKLS